MSSFVDRLFGRYRLDPQDRARSSAAVDNATSLRRKAEAIKADATAAANVHRQIRGRNNFGQSLENVYTRRT